MRKQTSLIILLGLGLSLPLSAGLGTGSANKPKPTPKPTGYRTEAQDEAYQKTIDDNDKQYNAQTTAINSDAYPKFLTELDSTYDAMVTDINNGGTGKMPGGGKPPTFTPTPVADTSGTGTTSATATTATGTSADGSDASMAQPTIDPNWTAEQVLIMDFCPRKCGAISDAGKQQECKSMCAQGAVATQATPENDMSSFLLMSLLLRGD